MHHKSSIKPGAESKLLPNSAFNLPALLPPVQKIKSYFCNNNFGL